MKKRLILIIAAFLSAAVLIYLLFPGYQRYQAVSSELFGTYITFTSYSRSEAKFMLYAEIIFDELERLHILYDVFNNYENINNLHTVNNQAGISPVFVDADIIELLLFGKQAYFETGGNVNILMGPVTGLWRNHREAALIDPTAAKTPDEGALWEAAKLMDIDDLVIDGQMGTVFLRHMGMSLDVGSLAKGFAAQKAVDLAVEAGMVSGLLDAGGNVVAVGYVPARQNKEWVVGIPDPILKLTGQNVLIEVLDVTNKSVVSSGNYERFYIAGGQHYGHIIDPKTLYPANLYAGVTVICQDSGFADMLSTAIFIMSVEEGEQLLENYNAGAIWVMHNGDVYKY